MRVFPSIVAGMMLVIGGGCAPTGGLTMKSVTAEMVQQNVRANSERVHTMRGSGRIAVETPEMAQSGSFELILRKPDSVLVKLEGPFGIEVGSVLLTRNGFLFYNSFRNEVITGSTTAANLNRILRVNVDFDDLLALFVGGTFFGDDGKEPDNFALLKEEYVLTYRHAHGERHYWVDPTSLLVTKIRHIDDKGKLLFEQSFSNFRVIAGTSVPYRVRMRQHEGGSAVSISYANISVNGSQIQFHMTIPKSAARVRWQ